MPSTTRTILALALVAAITASADRANADEPVPPDEAPAIPPPPPPPPGATPPPGAATPPSPLSSAVPTTPPPPPAPAPAAPAPAVPPPAAPAPAAPWQPPPRRDWTPYRVYMEDGDAKQGPEWYGWQTLIVMGVSTPLVLAFGAGLAGFTFGGPIVHWAHGNVGKGFGALGLNVGLTAVGGLIGYGLLCGSGCHGDFSGLAAAAGLGIGGGVGLLTANIIDVAALAYETPEPSEKKSARRRSPRLTIVPQLSLSSNAGYLGVIGAY